MVEYSRTPKEILEDTLKKVNLVIKNTKKLLNNGKKYITRKTRELAESEEALKEYLEKALADINGFLPLNAPINYSKMEEYAKEVYPEDSSSLVSSIKKNFQEKIDTNEELVRDFANLKNTKDIEDFGKVKYDIFAIYLQHVKH